MRVLAINFSPLSLLSLLVFASWTDVSNQSVGGVGEEACEVCNKPVQVRSWLPGAYNSYIFVKRRI